MKVNKPVEVPADVVPVKKPVVTAVTRLAAVAAVARAGKSCATRSTLFTSKAVTPRALNSLLMSFTDILTGSFVVPAVLVLVGPEVPLVLAGLVCGVGPFGEDGGVAPGEGVGETGTTGVVVLNLLDDDEPRRDLFLLLGIVDLNDPHKNLHTLTKKCDQRMYGKRMQSIRFEMQQISLYASKS